MSVRARACAWAHRQREGVACHTCASPPATCGHAIDVPDMVVVAVSLLAEAARTYDPGAHTSTARV